MDLVQKFNDYAAAFEAAYASDDWSNLGACFSADAAYYYSDGSEPVFGREQVIEKLQTAVNELDRKMNQRELEFLDISVAGDTVTAEWSARFGKDGLPTLDVTGREIARFSGDEISELNSVIDDEGLAAFGAWMEAHGHEL